MSSIITASAPLFLDPASQRHFVRQQILRSICADGPETALPPTFLAAVRDGKFSKTQIARIVSPQDRKTVLDAGKIFQDVYSGKRLLAPNQVAILNRAAAIVTSEESSILSPQRSFLRRLVESIQNSWKMYRAVEKQRSQSFGHLPRATRVSAVPSLQAESIAAKFKIVK